MPIIPPDKAQGFMSRLKSLDWTTVAGCILTLRLAATFTSLVLIGFAAEAQRSGQNCVTVHFD